VSNDRALSLSIALAICSLGLVGASRPGFLCRTIEFGSRARREC